MSGFENAPANYFLTIKQDRSTEFSFAELEAEVEQIDFPGLSSVNVCISSAYFQRPRMVRCYIDKKNFVRYAKSSETHVKVRPCCVCMHVRAHVCVFVLC